MTDSEIADLRVGDVVHEETPKGCRVWTVTTNAAPSRTATKHEAWARTASGTLVARITHSGSFHRPSLHKLKVVKEEA